MYIHVYIYVYIHNIHIYIHTSIYVLRFVGSFSACSLSYDNSGRTPVCWSSEKVSRSSEKTVGLLKRPSHYSLLRLE